MYVTVPRKNFTVPRCSAACPAGVDVPRYIRAVRQGKYDEAIAIVRERIPFPTVCADACFAPCEDVCAYKQFGEPLAIRALKRAAVDNGEDTWKKRKTIAKPTGKAVAVIGAGPAGLTAAYYLATLGHQVAVFDAFPEPGGAMRYGIPRYRLPKGRLKKDVDEILGLGVTFIGNTEVGKDITFQEIEQKHDAVFLTVGASSSARIPLEGAEKEGVLWGWDFLRDVNRNTPPRIGKNVVVVGGGNVAIDVALTARRLGAEKVDLFCLESRAEMPSHPWEVALAEEEGVFINNSWAPKKVLGDQKVAGLGLRRCTSVFDNACNFNPVYDDEITHKVPADTLILAVGQAPVFDFLADARGTLTSGNRIAVCGQALETPRKGVFAGGDAVTGPASIISAIAQGRRAAEAIDTYFGGAGNISEILAAPEPEVELDEFHVVVCDREDPARLKVWERVLGFDQVEKQMTSEQIKGEAARCLNCDARRFEPVVNLESCKECGYCAEVCGVGTYGPAAGFNAKGYKPMQVQTSDYCVGCFKCFFACPDFAIDITEVTGRE